MALNICSRIMLSLVLFGFFCVSHVSSECCSAYQDISGGVHPPQWCSEYCCYDPKTLGFTLYCCESEILRADQQYRSNFCIAWWAAHVYVPILVGLAILGGLLTCCCCCCGCCACCRKRTHVILQNQGSVPSVMVQQQMQQTAVVQDPFRAGYNQ